MSDTQTITLNCPKCQSPVKATRWVCLDAVSDPKAKESLLSADIFDLTCPSCGFNGLSAYPMIYRDSSRSLLISLVIEDDQLEACMASLSADSSASVKRIVRDINDLREKIMIFDQGLDDRVVQTAKIVAFFQLQKAQESRQVFQIYFFHPETGNNELQVLFTDGSSTTFELAPELYSSLAADFKELIEAKSKDRFIFDTQWAFELAQAAEEN